MSGSHMQNEQEHKSPRESGEDSEDESEILEESPCGRWLKRREEGITAAVTWFLLENPMKRLRYKVVDFWKLNKTPKLLGKMKRDCLHLFILIVIMTILNLMGIASHWPILGQDPNYFYAIHFYKTYFPKVAGILTFLYFASFSCGGYMMIINTYSLIYFMVQEKFQAYTINDHLVNLSKDFEHCEDYLLIGNQPYQDIVTRRLRSIIVFHQKLKEVHKELNESFFICWLILVPLAVMFVITHIWNIMADSSNVNLFRISSTILSSLSCLISSLYFSQSIKDEVEQRDVPGIDCAYLAMDTEEGVEVVWNEVQFSERKNFKNQEEKIQLIFENLTQLEHPNIVKFHRYWTDTHNDKPRVIFITEYMSSGSLKQFLKRTKRNVKRLPLQAWRRWCTQILSALSYLHSCSPPIIHGNLTCDTIFIQHNGLVKIGSVAPDSINHHVKTCQDDFKNMHFIAPEHPSNMGPPMDIYSFGMCALEMAALEIVGNGDSGNKVTEENIKKTIDSLEDEQQKDFIQKCLQRNPADRPTAKELLFHPLLFEVHSLKLLAAYCLVKRSANISETITDELMQRWYGPDVIVAEINRKSGPAIQMKMSDIPTNEKLEKFVEDVKNGIYPLTAFGTKQPPPARSRAISPEMAESVKSVTPEPMDVESRKIVNMMCDIKPKEESCDLMLTIVLRMDDKMNRHLTSCITQTDSPKSLAQELVHYGFINEEDRDKIASLIAETLRDCSDRSSPSGLFQPLRHLPASQPPMLNTAVPLTAVKSTPTQVPMHSTS